MRALAAAAAAGAALLSPGAALACGLQLILAMDVSGSIDSTEFALQAGGTASAFEDPRLAEAVEKVEGGIQVTLTHWSGASRQRQMTGWHHVDDAASATAFAQAIRNAGRAWRNFSTAVGEALMHAGQIGLDAPQSCARQVIDVSGDGVSNEGRGPGPIAESLAAQGVTINGLVILGAEPDPYPLYRDEVIAGPGAFIEVAETFEDYPETFLRKLLREIDQPLFVSDAGGAAGVPALSPK
ncbi:MAG: DUF1194 domain-containing protein [Pseudomonadota bacterium]